MNKYVLFLITALVYCSVQSQSRQNLGIVLGTTHFSSKSEAFNSSPQTGVAVGFMANFLMSERWEFTLGLRYDRHRLDFKGKETTNSPIEDIELVLKQIELPLTFTYNVISRPKFDLGLNFGASANLFHGYSTINSNKDDYFLLPSEIEVNKLFFDTDNGSIAFNTFLIGGLNFKFYKKVMFTGRYYHGILNPLRHAPEDNPLSAYEAELSYFFFGLTYFL